MKRIFYFLFLWWLATSATAQTRFGGGFALGLSLSQISGDNLSGFNRPGATAGVFGNYALNDRNWLQAEINFIQKGSYKAPKSEDPTKYSLNLNYVAFPLLYKFRPIGNRITFEVGPYVALLLSYTERSEIGDINLNVPFKKNELGVLAGLNYQFNKGLQLNLRVEQSVVPVRNHQGNAVFRINRGQYNTSLCLTLRYEFGGSSSQNK